MLIQSETAVKHAAAMNCGGHALIITCEHGGNRIPTPYRDLFLGHQTLLSSHHGFDPGALSMARTLADAFAAPLVSSTVSRQPSAR